MKKYDCTRKEAGTRLIIFQMTLFALHLIGVAAAIAVIMFFQGAAYLGVLCGGLLMFYLTWRAVITKHVSLALVLALENDTFTDD